MSWRWPVLALATSVLAWVLPLVLAPGSPGSPGVPTWVFISYAVSGLALLAFIGLLVAWLALRSRA